MKKIELDQMEMIEGGKDKGQNTLDCITDAYSNHGWTSVGLTILSIFAWGAPVAIAAACAGANQYS